jgi:hypothetical protein
MNLQSGSFPASEHVNANKLLLYRLFSITSDHREFQNLMKNHYTRDIYTKPEHFHDSLI